MATKKRKKKFPFKHGQKVRYKDQTTNDYGIVWSAGPAKIGNNRSRIPGGPLVFPDFVYVRWIINGKKFICIEYIKDLDIVRR